MDIIEIIRAIVAHKQDIITIIAYAISIASIIVKLTPTLKDDNVLLGIIKFIGKYIALEKYGPTSRPS